MHPMSYDQWRRDLDPVAASNDRVRAQLWNLENETRIPAALSDFKTFIGGHYTAAQAGAGGSAADTLQAACDDCKPPDSRWLGRLPWSDSADVPAAVNTFITASDADRYKVEDFERDRPPSEIHLQRFKGVRTSGTANAYRPWKRFIWVTWPTQGHPELPSDPTAIKRELGLAHFREAEFVYRVPLSRNGGQKLFVPTCLDAELYHAWSPPPANSPWGMTRDLTSGRLCWPELLAEAADFLDRELLAQRMPPNVGYTPVGPVDDHPMAGR